jgi:hypothetical protein
MGASGDTINLSGQELPLQAVTICRSVALGWVSSGLQQHKLSGTVT